MPPARDHMRIADLADVPLLLPSRPNASRRLLDNWVARTGITLNIRAEVDDHLMIRGLIRAGVGCSLLTQGAFIGERARGEVAALRFRPRAYWPLAIFAIVATAHAVNLTDGLDGLAAGTGAIAFGAFGAIALLTPNYKFTGQFCFTMVGALLAFLWFNIYPARVFMGDTGSLALGATLATVALLMNQLLILPVVGFVFVIITVSVMLQVGYFKLTDGRRLLRMAPLQHHLELIGWHENQITQRFWIVTMLAGVAGLALAFS